MDENTYACAVFGDKMLDLLPTTFDFLYHGVMDDVADDHVRQLLVTALVFRRSMGPKKFLGQQPTDGD